MGFATTKYLVDQAIGGGGRGFSWQKACYGAAYAATAGRWYDLSMMIGNPAANIYPATGGPLKVSVLNYLSPGNMWHGANTSPSTTHLTRAAVWTASATTAPSVMMLCDYLMYYPLIRTDTTTDQQVFDNTGASLPRYTDGQGVMMMLVVTADLGATATTAIINYQNSSGVDQQTTGGTCYVAGGLTGVAPAYTQFTIPASSFVSTIATSAAATAGCFAPFIPLCPGDFGVLKVNSIQFLSGMGGGLVCLVLVRPIAWVPVVTVSVPSERDYGISLPSYPRVYDGAFLNMLMFPGAAVPSGSTFQGYTEYVFG